MPTLSQAFASHTSSNLSYWKRAARLQWSDEEFKERCILLQPIVEIMAKTLRTIPEPNRTHPRSIITLIDNSSEMYMRRPSQSTPGIVTGSAHQPSLPNPSPLEYALQAAAALTVASNATVNIGRTTTLLWGAENPIELLDNCSSLVDLRNRLETASKECAQTQVVWPALREARDMAGDFNPVHILVLSTAFSFGHMNRTAAEVAALMEQNPETTISFIVMGRKAEDAKKISELVSKWPQRASICVLEDYQSEQVALQLAKSVVDSARKLEPTPVAPRARAIGTPRMHTDHY